MNIWDFIWIGVAAAVFAFLWRKGYLLRLSQYVGQTKMELRKCAWPTINELKGSTVVVIIATAIMGLFVVGIDFVVRQIMDLIM